MAVSFDPNFILTSSQSAASLVDKYITHTHPFNGPFSGTTQVSRYQKDKTNLDFAEARDREWQWHQLGHMQVCTSLQTNNHASTPPLKFFTGRMPFLQPNQQRQSTKGNRQVYQLSLIDPLTLISLIVRHTDTRSAFPNVSLSPRKRGIMFFTGVGLSVCLFVCLLLRN